MALLERIHSPENLKELPIDDLPALSEELRAEIMHTVNKNGGHLGGPLGVVELTVALHYVFDVGVDQLVWDVGHQCYAHKLLTGRRDRFHTLRTKDGISGYPKRKESQYDAFGTGHSSTSISAALGMAAAREHQAKDHHVVAVIGDGAMTGGMALEGLSNAGHLGHRLIVVLNDNEMSIAPNVGALARYFNRLIMAAPYKRAKEDAGKFVKRLLGERAVHTVQEMEKSVKGFITKGYLFQEFGFNYIGPVDGHDLPLLIECFHNLKQMNGPILLHVRTEKGKGLKEAEEDPLKYHGVKPKYLPEKHEEVHRPDDEGVPLPAAKLEAKSTAKAAPSFTDAFANALVDAGARDQSVVAITAAMPSGTGLNKFQDKFPERFYDVGISEQHAVTFAAGLSAQGMRPVAAIYSTFLQRGYDQLIHDVAIQHLPVVFAIDRAGLVGEDCPTHNGAFDLAYLRTVPDMKVAAPRDDVDTALMLAHALKQDAPFALRYARAKAVTLGDTEDRDITRGEILREGSDAMFLAVGPLVGQCLEAAELLAGEGHSVGVADARWVKPLDSALIDALAGKPIITVEEGALMGGFGSAVLEYLSDSGQIARTPVHRAGLPDVHPEAGTRDEQLVEFRLDALGLASQARQLLPAGVAPAK